MATLEHCLIKHRDAITNPENAGVREAKAEYMSSGISEQEAAVQAIKDRIRLLETERKGHIDSGMKQWKANDPSGFEVKSELGVPDNFLKQVKIDFPVMEEDGTITMEVRSAKDAIESLDKQEAAYRALRDCVA